MICSHCNSDIHPSLHYSVYRVNGSKTLMWDFCTLCFDDYYGKGIDPILNRIEERSDCHFCSKKLFPRSFFDREVYYKFEYTAAYLLLCNDCYEENAPHESLP